MWGNMPIFARRKIDFVYVFIEKIIIASRGGSSPLLAVLLTHLWLQNEKIV